MRFTFISSNQNEDIQALSFSCAVHFKTNDKKIIYIYIYIFTDQTYYSSYSL
jgi:hypothetical protein